MQQALHPVRQGQECSSQGLMEARADVMPRCRSSISQMTVTGSTWTEVHTVPRRAATMNFDIQVQTHLLLLCINRS